MTPATPDQLLAAASAKLRERQPAEAEKLCRQALQIEPNHANALHLLALVLASSGRLQDAIEWLRKAIAAAPTRPELYSNLGMILMQLGRIENSIAAFHQALQLRPDHAPTRNNFGAVLATAGRMNRAIEEFQHAVRIRPDDSLAWLNLGNAYLARGSPAEAERAIRQSLALKPDRREAKNQLGVALLGLHRDDEALNEFKQAVATNPNDAEAHNNLGLYHLNHHDLDEAAASFDRAIAAHPKYPQAINNLGKTLQSKGDLDQALACFARAIDISPGYEAAIGNRLHALHLKSTDDPALIMAEHRAWNQKYAERLREAIRPHSNDRDPNRPLKIGYFLPKSSHPPTWIALHDAARIYSDDPPQSETWRCIAGMSNDEAADLIRQDAIDILVDLAMHLPGGRPMLFARKPAPVQVTGLAYPGTTGLWSMDYRLTDPHIDPPGQHDENYSEQSVRLPETLFVYSSPLRKAQEFIPGASPLTFASLSSFDRVNDFTLNLWSEILNSIPDSRLILSSPRGDHRAKTISKLAVSSDRIEFIAPQPHGEFLNFHNRIHIRLDTFPCNGRTSSLDSWWMGVPVVSLWGRTAVSRAGFSIATNLGLADLVAHTPDDYVRIACELAADAARLSSLRAELPARMTNSPLMDAPRMVRNVEDAYRTMWRKWCTK